MPLYYSASRWKCCYYWQSDEKSFCWEQQGFAFPCDLPTESITSLAITSCCLRSLHPCVMLSKSSVNCDQACCLRESTKLNLMPSNPGWQAAGSSSWGSQFQSLQPPNIFKVSYALHRSTHGLFLLKVHRQFSNILCSEGERRLFGMLIYLFIYFARQFCVAISTHLTSFLFRKWKF